MLFPSLFTAVLAGTALALPAEKRDNQVAVQIVEADIGGIDAAVRQTTAAINAYNGGLVQATPVLAGVGEIHLVNRNAYIHALAPIQLNSTESGQVVVFTENTVGQSIPTAIEATKAKRQQFDAAGLHAGIVDGLTLLRNDHDSYSAALLTHVSPDWAARAQAVINKIHNSIQGGIDFYNA